MHWIRCVIGVVVLGLLAGCAGLGKAPTSEQKKLYAGSTNFDTASGTFVNAPDPEQDSIWEQRRKAVGKGDQGDGDAPGFLLPMVKPDLAAFLSGDSGFRSIWLGHSSVLMRLGGATILIDPVFGRSSPVPFAGGPRFQDPPISRDEIPEVDVVVISHDHYDHLEKATIQFYAQRGTRFVVPLGVSWHLRHWGVKDRNIVELDWWDSARVAGVEFIATPARHSSGRLDRRTNHTLWASWVLRTPSWSVYHSGDTGYGKHFAQIGERFGPFDMVYLENGQYSPAWRSHLLPEEWPRAMRELKGKRWHPIHWGAFSFAPHRWNDPIVAADSLARRHGIPLIAPRPGEIVDPREPRDNVRWWESQGS